MRPTLDELDDFLCGQADEETRVRVGADLAAPSSALRLFVEGIRMRAEGLSAWEGTYDGDDKTRHQVEQNLARRCHVGCGTWVGYFLGHIVFWAFWAVILTWWIAQLTDSQFTALGIGTWACLVGWCIDVGLVLRGERPPSGTLWESLAGGVAGTAPFVLVLLAMLLPRRWASEAAIAVQVVGSVTVVTAFVGSVVGLSEGFGLRGKLLAGKLTMGRLFLRWAVSSFAFSGVVWILVLVLAYIFPSRIVFAIAVFVPGICIPVGNIMLSLEDLFLDSDYRHVGIASLAGTLVGLVYGAFSGALYAPFSWVAFCESIVGWAWALGAVSCADVLLGGFAKWQDDFAWVVRMLMTVVLTVSVLAIVLLMLKYLGVLAVLDSQNSPGSDPFQFLFAFSLIIGAYLGLSGKWLIIVPKKTRLLISEGWKRWTAQEEAEMPMEGRLHAAMQVASGSGAQVLRIYSEIVDSLRGKLAA